VTCGKELELCKVSCREWGPRELVCSGGLLTLGIPVHVWSMMLGWKGQKYFFSKTKLQNFYYCIFCVCDEMALIQVFIENVIF